MKVRRLVLDVHGVVLNNPLPAFLVELARETAQAPEALRRRWTDEIRRDTWLGRIPDREVWSRLTLDRGGEQAWLRRLEERYAPGPAAAHVDRWRRRAPIWLLSNHRSPWLLPRLARLDLHEPFATILVSDDLGALKPERSAFEAALAGLDGPEGVLFVDDQAHIVEAARALGLESVQARPGDAGWVDAVDARLG